MLSSAVTQDAPDGPAVQFGILKADDTLSLGNNRHYFQAKVTS